MNEDIKEKGKMVSGLMNNYLQTHVEENKKIKVPSKLGDSITHHKQGPDDLLKELLNRQIFQESADNDQEIQNQIAQLSSGARSDSNMIKVEVQTLVKFLIDINHEMKNPKVDLEKIKNDLESLSLQAKEMKAIETSVIILKATEARSDEIVSLCKNMEKQIGEKTFESSMQKLLDLVMNFATDLKKESKDGEGHVVEVKDAYQPISKSYQELSELVGMPW